MHSAKLVWATPNLDDVLAYIARVSNPDGQDKPIGGLFLHMMKEGHSSPFQMANVCVEVNTTRAIGRQLLRHWTAMPQEFSQRYAAVGKLGDFVWQEFRLQHDKNRQMSVDVPPDDLRCAVWLEKQEAVLKAVEDAYSWALANGGAKEIARAVLPEGMTPTRMYFNAPVRTWIFYLKERLNGSATQKEHVAVATDIFRICSEVAPVTFGTFFPDAL